MTNKISNEPFYDDSTLTMTTPQIELGNTASSFIVTTMPTTRASDVVTIPRRITCQHGLYSIVRSKEELEYTAQCCAKDI